MEKYINLKDFNYKDYFEMLDFNCLLIDARTKQLFDLYCLNLTNPIIKDFDKAPAILIDAITYINYLIKLITAPFYG